MDLFDVCYSFHDPELAKLAGLYPFFRSVSKSEGPVVEVDHRKVIMLGSNNYLGLTHHPEVIQAAHEAIDRYGTGCTGSRFLNGNLDLHETLEAELAAFLGKPAVLVFAAGFLANVGVIGTLGGATGAVIFMATENHASLIDGARMANSRRMRVFQNLADLERQLGGEQKSWGHALVVTDGVFSMTGRVADLKGLTDLRRKYGFRLYVDDAHGFGVLGTQGRGTAEAAGVSDDIDVLFGTFSKSFASQGGFVAGEIPVIEYLRHKARTFMFSAGLAPASAAAALAALRVMQRDKSIFTRLWENVEFFKNGVEALGFQTLGTTTPIVPLFTGSEKQAFQMCVEALDMGLFATPAVYPAVPPGHALIRTSVTPAHTREHLEKALDILKKLTKRYPVPTVDAATLPPARTVDLEEVLMEAAAAAAAAGSTAAYTQNL